jgi:hypothetical protein
LKKFFIFLTLLLPSLVLAENNCENLIREKAQASVEPDKKILLEAADRFVSVAITKEGKEKLNTHIQKKYGPELALLKSAGVEFIIAGKKNNDASLPEEANCDSASGVFLRKEPKKLILCLKSAGGDTLGGFSSTFEHEFVHFLQDSKLQNRDQLLEKYMKMSGSEGVHVHKPGCKILRHKSFSEISKKTAISQHNSEQKLSEANKLLLDELRTIESLYLPKLDSSGELFFEEKKPENTTSTLETFFNTRVKGKKVGTLQVFFGSFFSQFYEKKGCSHSSFGLWKSCYEQYLQDVKSRAQVATKSADFKLAFQANFVDGACLGAFIDYCDEWQGLLQENLQALNQYNALKRAGLDSMCGDFLQKEVIKAAGASSSAEASDLIYRETAASLSNALGYGRTFSLVHGHNFPLFKPEYCGAPPPESFLLQGCKNWDPKAHKQAETQTDTGRSDTGNSDSAK